jgi:stromal membrane-associated protein
MQAPSTSVSFGRFPPLNSSTTVDRSAAVAALLGPSRSAASLPSRQQTKDAPPTPTTSSVTSNPMASNPVGSVTTPVSRAAPVAAQSPSLPSTIARNPPRSVSQPVITSAQAQLQPQHNGVWGDMQLIQQRSATINATLPLQVASFTSTSAATPPMTIPTTLSTPSLLATPSSNGFSHLSASPGGMLPISLNQQNSVGRSVSLGSGLTATTTGMPFGSSSYQNNMQVFQPSLSPMVPAQSLTPSPNPFSPQPLPVGAMSPGMNGMTPSPQPQFVPSASPYGQPALNPQSSQPQFFQQSPSQPQQMFASQTLGQFAPQPTGPFTPQPSGQFSSPMNPYGQAQPVGPGTPFITTTPQPYIGGTPSPFGQAQPTQQVPMQQGYAMQSPGANANTNPFTSWIQQPPQQQQWGR